MNLNQFSYPIIGDLYFLVQNSKIQNFIIYCKYFHSKIAKSKQDFLSFPLHFLRNKNDKWLIRPSQCDSIGREYTRCSVSTSNKIVKFLNL